MGSSALSVDRERHRARQGPCLRGKAREGLQVGFQRPVRSSGYAQEVWHGQRGQQEAELDTGRHQTLQTAAFHSVPDDREC